MCVSGVSVTVCLEWTIVECWRWWWW